MVGGHMAFCGAGEHFEAWNALRDHRVLWPGSAKSAVICSILENE
jgi:hypothetical protein